MSVAPLVTVIVLHWLNYERTRRCLQTLERLDYPSYRVTLVDNGSFNGSLERLQAEFPWVDVLALPTNYGFAGGVNPAMRHALDAGSDYILLLNNDALAPPDLLTELVAVQRRHPRIGVLTPVAVRSDQPGLRAGLGYTIRPYDLDLVGWDEPDTLAAEQEPVYLDAVFGAATLIPRAVLERVGLFDERFFFYYEDVDLCVRARAAGFSVAYVPGIRVRHDIAASTANIRGLRFYYLGRGRQLFFRKHRLGWSRVLYMGRELYKLFREAPFRVKYEGAANVISYLAGSLAGLFMPVPHDGAGTPQAGRDPASLGKRR
jgi:GT2 family glycosyltransferase